MIQKVIEFPYGEPEIIDASLPDDILIFHAKRIWSRLINKAVLGIRPLTEEDKERIREINSICIEYGYEPLHSDFETL